MEPTRTLGRRVGDLSQRPESTIDSFEDFEVSPRTRGSRPLIPLIESTRNIFKNQNESFILDLENLDQDGDYEFAFMNALV